MNKQLTTKQEIFLDNLIDCEGDAKKAAELAGYAPNSHFQVVKSLKTEILDRTESILAQSAPKAALKITDIMNSTQPIPQANIRMQAAQTILDRVGIAKTDRIDLKIEAPTGLFILPAKKETVIEYEEEE
tara:strand:- start:338 stop:727 length:390 start_codon:yes stop_codon:yes gene_type:complete